MLTSPFDSIYTDIASTAQSTPESTPEDNLRDKKILKNAAMTLKQLQKKYQKKKNLESTYALMQIDYLLGVIFSFDLMKNDSKSISYFRDAIKKLPVLVEGQLQDPKKDEFENFALLAFSAVDYLDIAYKQGKILPAFFRKSLTSTFLFAAQLKNQISEETWLRHIEHCVSLLNLLIQAESESSITLARVVENVTEIFQLGQVDESYMRKFLIAEKPISIETFRLLELAVLIKVAKLEPPTELAKTPKANEARIRRNHALLKQIIAQIEILDLLIQFAPQGTIPNFTKHEKEAYRQLQKNSLQDLILSDCPLLLTGEGSPRLEPQALFHLFTPALLPSSPTSSLQVAVNGLEISGKEGKKVEGKSKKRFRSD